MSTVSALALSESDRTRRGTGPAPRKRIAGAARPAVAHHFGNEPPLDPNAPAPATLGRHTLSLRWLGASILAAIAGCVLLGSAIYVSSEGDLVFADPAERADVQAVRSGSAPGGGAGKADKLVRADNVAVAKQSFRQPMTLRVGEREIIKVRNFVRIATNLATTSGNYATDIPPFNPLRFFADSGENRVADLQPETSDAEVSVTKSDLSTIAVDFGPSPLTDEQVATGIREELRLRAEAGRRNQSALAPTAMLSRLLVQPAAPPPGADLPSSAADGAFRSLEVRVVPENVTDLPKSVARAPEVAFEEKVVPIRRGDTLEALLRANGATPDDLRPLLAALGSRDPVATLEGMQLRLLLSPTGRPGEARRLLRAILFGERGIEAVAAMNDRGAFVSVTPPQSPTRNERRRSGEDEDDDEGGGVTLYSSLYETALKQELPRQTVEDLVRIFGYDVDFQRRVVPGDSFELFYAQDEEAGGERPEILSAVLTVGSDTHRIYRFQGDDGTIEYFDEAGRSLRKFLIRKPVVEARLSSGFGTRYHPILGYAKMHTGVDWAAKAGTPILAAGNGTVIKAEWDSGYGRRVEVQHANGYVTTYNHMSAFGRGIAPGAKIRQGRVVGYVGSTGLSTGAHLHYEVVVNGHFVDPMRIRVPRGRELDGRALTEFGRQREQIDQLLLKAGPSRFAQR